MDRESKIIQIIILIHTKRGIKITAVMSSIIVLEMSFILHYRTMLLNFL